MAVSARANGMLALAKMFSNLEKNKYGGEVISPIAVGLEAESVVSGRSDTEISLTLSDYGKSCKGTWEGYIKFPEPPKFADEILFSPGLCGAEAVLTHLQRKSAKIKGVSITVKTPGLMGDPFGRQCLSSDSSVIACTIFALAKHYKINESELPKILEIAETYRSGEQSCGVPLVAYSGHGSAQPASWVIGHCVAFSTGMGSYKEEFMSNFAQALEANPKKLSGTMSKSAEAELLFAQALKSKDEKLLRGSMAKFDSLCEQLRDFANLKLGSRIEGDIDELRKFASIVPLEFNYSAHYIAVPARDSDYKILTAKIKDFGWEIHNLSEKKSTQKKAIRKKGPAGAW